MKGGSVFSAESRQTCRGGACCCVVFAILLILCSFGIENRVTYLEQYAQTVQLMVEPGIPVTDARQMIEESAGLEADYEFVFWRQGARESVSDPCLPGKQMETTVIFICGNSDLLFPEAGHMGLQDTASCLISSKTAYTLFGSCEVEGLEVVCGGNTYLILDVIELAQDLLVCVAEASENQLLDRVSIATRSEKSPVYLAEEFESRWCEGDYIDLELILFLLKGGICIVYAVLLCGVLLGIRKRKGMIFLICRLSGMLCCGVMILKNLFVPADYLTNISDKMFWKELIESKVYHFELFLIAEKSMMDLSFIKAIIIIFLLIIAVCGTAYMQKAAEQ